ncbi:MAG: acetate uptake transporter [Gaiellales bacterium]
MLRPIGSPLPLGFFAFGTGTMLFTCLELGWVGLDQTRPLALIMLIFVAPLVVLPGLLAYWTRDAASATALCMFGMVWAALAVLLLTSPAGQTSAIAGVFLLCLSLFQLLLAGASVNGKPAFAITVTVAALRFALTGLYQITGHHWMELASGWAGIPLAVAAVYLGLALLLEDAQHRTVLPLGRRGVARMAVESHLGDQVQAIEREAGIRRQL